MINATISLSLQSKLDTFGDRCSPSTKILPEGIDGTNEESGAILESTIKQLFKEKVRMQKDDFAFECLWDQALTNHAIDWTGDKPLDLRTFRRIGLALEGDCVFQGEGVTAQSAPEGKLHALTEYLLGRNTLPNEMSKEEALAIFYEEVERDPVGTCLLFQDELKQVFKKAADLEIPRIALEPKREELFKMFIGHMVAVLPFAYPKEGDTFPIPVKINGDWVLKEYKVDERIELTPGPFSPLLAFGLVAEDGDLEAPPLLTLSGTTWGEGRFVSILADFTPFMSVGHVPYLFGQNKINAWMDRHDDVHLFGASLGGALCFHVLRNHSNRVSSVNVYNPPGLYTWLWKGPIDRIEVNIYLQQNDIVSTAGYFPTGSDVRVFRIVGEQSDGWREAHGRGYGGGQRVTLIRSSSAYENSRWDRTAWTVLLFVTGLTVGASLWTFFLLACLYHYLKEKTCELIDCCKRKWSYEPPQNLVLAEIEVK